MLDSFAWRLLRRPEFAPNEDDDEPRKMAFIMKTSKASNANPAVLRVFPSGSLVSGAPAAILTAVHRNI